MQLLHNAARIGGTRTVPDPGGLVGWVLGCMRRLRSERRSITKQMHLLEILSLGGKKQLALVSCAGRLFLVGGGSDTVQTIVGVRGDASPENAMKELEDTCF